MATTDPDQSRRAAGGREGRRYTALDVFRDMGFHLALVLAGTVVVEITEWSRLHVLLTFVVVGWSVRAAVQYWLRRHAADSAGVR